MLKVFLFDFFEPNVVVGTHRLGASCGYALIILATYLLPFIALDTVVEKRLGFE